MPQLMQEMGYRNRVHWCRGGLPKLMGIPGEGLNGIFSANESDTLT